MLEELEYKVINDVTQYPEVGINSKGDPKVLDTHVNLQFLLTRFGAKMRYNLMARKPEIYFPGKEMPSENLENFILGWADYLCEINLMPRKNIANHLDMIALQNTYHPIVDHLAKNPWDGKQRLDLFTQTLQTDDPDLTNLIVKTWMVAAVAAAHSIHGFVNQGVLVLQGEQNLGKTTWIKNLDPIGCNAVKEGIFLDPTNKDSILQIASFWIVELGELDSIFGKAAIGRLKSYLTMNYDLVRSPYARKPTELARRTVYAATVNEENYLIDNTGNRRWWTVKVDKIIFDHGINMVQVWAEAYALLKAGHRTCLEREVQNSVNEMNKKHERIDPLEEAILDFYDWEHPAERLITCSEILNEIGWKRGATGELQRIGYVMKKLLIRHGVGTRPTRTNKARYTKVPPIRSKL